MPRMLVDPLVQSTDLGMEADKIAEAYSVSVDTIRTLRAWVGEGSGTNVATSLCISRSLRTPRFDACL